MTRSSVLAVGMCMWWGVQAAAHADDKHSQTRGELLYTTHCSACHGEQVHWREKKLAKDWGSLVKEVRRWQANAGLTWSEEEIADTARYLNAIYYQFPADDKKTTAPEGGYSGGGY